jgi:hypothetical protein
MENGKLSSTKSVKKVKRKGKPKKHTSFFELKGVVILGIQNSVKSSSFLNRPFGLFK